MKEREFELSRRRILASVGGIGVTSAAGGLGTSAFFSDREDFEGNRLVAGELDMMVDWEEHYSDWSSDENDDWVASGILGDPDESDVNLDEDDADDFDVVMAGGDPGAVPDGYVGMPVPMEPLLAVPEDFVNDFMANTAIEAFPDSDDDGLQDVIYTRDQLSNSPGLSGEKIEETFRSQFANMPTGLSSDTRTDSRPDGIGGPPNPQVTAPGDPLIDIGDVKPGDFGEVTFSLHLFDNPGYIWLTGGLVDADENGNTEPEAKDPDEIGPGETDPEGRVLFDNEGDESDDPGSTNPDTTEQEPVELLDEIQVLVWHDDGDNVLSGPNYEGGEEIVSAPHDVDGDTTISLSQSEAIVFRGTFREVLWLLGSGGIPLDADPQDSERDCYPNSTTRYVCFAWWLPVDHANELQGDSVSFDLGFYTEQCRHNDGSGMAPDGVTMPSTVFVDAADKTVGTTTSHRVEVFVGDDIAGGTLDELVVDYPSDFDISGVDPGDVFNVGVEDPGGGAVSTGVASATAGDGDTALTFTFGSPLAGIPKGYTIFIEYDDAVNASTADTYTVDVSVNGTGVGSDTLDIVS